MNKEPHLLATDNPVVLPVGAVIRIQVIGDDVIHSWGVPSLGVKIDAVPGRLSETWVRIDKPGTYYGQCSQLCGINHGFMRLKSTPCRAKNSPPGSWSIRANNHLRPRRFISPTPAIKGC